MKLPDQDNEESYKVNFQMGHVHWMISHQEGDPGAPKGNGSTNTTDDQGGKQRSVSAEKNVCCLPIIINPTNPERVTRVVSGAKQSWEATAKSKTFNRTTVNED
jgi:hypothetical protein